MSARAVALLAALLGGPASGDAKPKRSPNRGAVSVEAASKLWTAVAKSMARVQGTITVDTEVQGTLSGSCSDIVVQVVEAAATDELHSVKAWGNVATGTCAYALFVKPRPRLRVRAFYGGGLGAQFPGDYPEVNMVATAFDAIAGRTTRRDGELTYDFIK